MVLLILRNISFDHDLPMEEDHVSSIQIATPHLYARVVQSFLAMENGDEPLEHFMFLEKEDQLDPGKLLFVVSDPFHIDFNSRKIVTALYGEMNKLIVSDPFRHTAWQKQVIELAAFLRTVSIDIPLEIDMLNELTVQDVCKVLGLRIDCPADASPQVRVCKLMDIMAEWMPKKLLVLCNLDSYFSEADWQEMIKYACYTKVRLLPVMHDAGIPLHPQEIRWQIDENFDDKIIRM